MKKLLYTLFFVLVGTLMAQAQDEAISNENPLDKLKFIIGEWEGEGWMMTQTGKQSTKIKETASCKAGGTVLVLEGLGTKLDTITNEEKVVHDAFGVIYLDPRTNTLALHAYKDGYVNESNIEFINDKKIRWFLDIPNGSKIRFTADYSTENKWVEIGEFSRDGSNWVQFLGMELTKTAN
ncbi:MAG TPA: hypothetical protein VGA80_15505 [Flavobacteriaceae bacterium]